MQKTPTLIIVTGFPATGKTTLARKLSEHFRLPLVYVDELKEMMFDRIGNWEDEKLFDSVSKAAYDLMYHITGLTLSAGQSCIIEGFFRAELASPRIAELKEKYNCNILQLQVNCDPHIMIERYDSRHNSSERHSCHPAISDEIKEKFIELEGKNPSPEVDGETIVIDTTNFESIDWSLIFQKVKEYINLSGVDFLKSLARKRVAAGILLYNKEGKVLILKPTYKDNWTIPGGSIEEGEFLLDGLKREMREEIGLEAEIKKLSVVDSKIVEKEDYVDDSLQIIFEGEILSDEQITRIKPSLDEISEFKFVDWEEALKLLNPNLSKRISHISKQDKSTLLLNNGELAKE